MDIEDISIAAFLSLLVAVFAASSYGAYKTGRYLERKELTAAYKASMEQDYLTGLQDGYNKARKELKDECEEEPEHDGRY